MYFGKFAGFLPFMVSDLVLYLVAPSCLTDTDEECPDDMLGLPN